jgi:hypothetical protein
MINRGILPILLLKWVMKFIIVIFVDFIQHFWRFLANIGGYWAIFEAIFWGEVGRWLPTPDLYKPGLPGSMEDIQRRFMLNIFQAKAIFMQGSY